MIRKLIKKGEIIFEGEMQFDRGWFVWWWKSSARGVSADGGNRRKTLNNGAGSLNLDFDQFPFKVGKQR